MKTKAAIVIGILVLCIAGCGGGSSTGQPSQSLQDATHQIYFIDGLHHAVVNYNTEGFYGIALETEHQIRDAQIYLEEETSTAVLGEACDDLQRSIFCQG
jgi:hypothetical protein